MRRISLPQLLVFVALSPVALLSTACGGSSESSPDCTVDRWEACGAPSLEARSVAWPEERASLVALADATERAVASPEHWDEILGAVASPGVPAFVEAWPTPVRRRDQSDRYEPIVAADSTFSELFTVLYDLRLSRTDSTVAEARRYASGNARDAFAALSTASMFEDPFGQPEPRSALFSYARAATVLQFLAAPEDRRAIADEARSVLERQLSAWEAMQRARFAPGSAELGPAIDAIGAPEIRRLFASWRSVEDLRIFSIDG